MTGAGARRCDRCCRARHPSGASNFFCPSKANSNRQPMRAGFHPSGGRLRERSWRRTAGPDNSSAPPRRGVTWRRRKGAWPSSARRPISSGLLRTSGGCSARRNGARRPRPQRPGPPRGGPPARGSRKRCPWELGHVASLTPPLASNRGRDRSRREKRAGPRARARGAREGGGAHRASLRGADRPELATGKPGSAWRSNRPRPTRRRGAHRRGRTLPGRLTGSLLA